MIDKRLADYLYEKLPKRSPLFEEMEKFAKAEQVPIMDPYSMETLLQLLRLNKPRTIIEIGAAIGYSALRMAEATNAKVVTVERDTERIVKAKEYINRSNLKEHIVLLEGDALELSDQAAEYGPFDCLFIDAAKGQYKRFFEEYEPHLSENGIIITDNVLFKGHVYDESVDNKRLQKLGKKIDEYNNWLISHPSYQTVILPVGDGIAVSVKN